MLHRDPPIPVAIILLPHVNIGLLSCVDGLTLSAQFYNASPRPARSCGLSPFRSRCVQRRRYVFAMCRSKIYALIYTHRLFRIVLRRTWLPRAHRGPFIRHSTFLWNGACRRGRSVLCFCFWSGDCRRGRSVLCFCSQGFCNRQAIGRADHNVQQPFGALPTTRNYMPRHDRQKEKQETSLAEDPPQIFVCTEKLCWPVKTRTHHLESWWEQP